MSWSPKAAASATCACGNVELELSGAAIMAVACYCDSCQEGGRRLEALPNAPPVLQPDAGTPYVMLRKDRVRCIKGAALLKGLKLRASSPTNRVVATCCNSAMLLNFDDNKHWVDVYRQRVREPSPALEMRICTKFKSDRHLLPDDIPNYPGYSFKFMRRLLAARIAMIFGS
jgi:hypothetical protein